MEKLLSEGDSVLLGYGRDHRNPPEIDSDIDFSDVFGGPPRKQSFIEMRHSYSESASSHGRDSAELSRSSPWSVRNEKPVFGEDASTRRRFTTDDFFNDIFRGNDSVCNSPRKKKNEFDSFGSNPSSRVRSPTLPETLGTSAPSQFSLPSRVNKDNASGGSSYYAQSPLSRSSNRENPIRNQDESGKPDGETGSGNLRNGMVDPDVSKKTRNFHFSIYKWPNRGVPVSMPLGRLSGLRFKGKGNVEVMAEELLPSETLDDICVKKPNSNASVDSEFCKTEKEENSRESTGQKNRTDSVSNKTLSERSVNETLVGVSETRKPESTRLSEFLDDKDDEQLQNSTADSGVHESNKKVNATASSLPDQGETGKHSKIKGKVNEFVKKFNQGAPTRTDVESLGQSSRYKTRVTAKTEIKADNDNTGTERPDKDVPDKEQKPSKVKVSEKQDPDKQNGGHKSGCASGEEDRQEPSKDDTDEPFHVTFQVKELIEDEDEPSQTEDIQAIEGKIRKWSSGKQGNIRSLLSTLQYILWEGSGWKQVPLMDMIEGNAVRKSYQRALLILHPDKLQQKGASSSQKYIAERVFELLQESWEHYNSLGPL